MHSGLFDEEIYERKLSAARLALPITCLGMPKKQIASSPGNWMRGCMDLYARCPTSERADCSALGGTQEWLSPRGEDARRTVQAHAGDARSHPPVLGHAATCQSYYRRGRYPAPVALRRLPNCGHEKDLWPRRPLGLFKTNPTQYLLGRRHEVSAQ